MIPSNLVGFAIQPVAFAAKNGWDVFAYLSLEFLCFSVFNNDVSALENTKRMIHLRPHYARRRKAGDGVKRLITMHKFVRVNRLQGPVVIALLHLEDVVQAGSNVLVTERLLAAVENLTGYEQSRYC